jgi:hypothetical protein
MKSYHPLDMQLFAKKELEFYTLVFVTWGLDREQAGEYVTRDEVMAVVDKAEEEDKACFVLIKDSYIEIPLAYLRSSAEASSMVLEDLRWRLVNIKPDQRCQQGFDILGRDINGRHLITYAAKYIKEKSIRDLEAVRLSLESAFNSSK